MKTIVFTGNHLTPAQAVKEQLPDSIKVIDVVDNTSPKFKRYDWWGSFWDLWRLPQAVLKAKARLQAVKAEAVVSFGGYSAVPICLAAKILGRPVLIHEQTFSAGLASRLTAWTATKIAVSWRSSFKLFRPEKTVLTGNPVRQAVLKVKRRPFDLIYICGGHQGARAINSAVLTLIPELVKNYQVYHQFGLNQPPAFKHARYISRRFFPLEELVRIYAKAKVVVSRAGINTVTELGYLKIPAVLIPLPYTQAGEQEKNARYLESLGLAVVLTQEKLTPASLSLAISRAEKLSGSGLKKTFPRQRVEQAADKICRLIVKLSGET